MEALATPHEVIAFWREAGPDRWFAKDAGFDEACRARFLPTYEAAARGDLNDEWELSPEGSLALVLVLDQFPRNMFRGERRAFATDPAALLVADRALEKGHEEGIEPPLRRFLAMPFMHSEEPADQERCVALARRLGDEETVKYAQVHYDIIARFGRFPHRNAVLGRETTAEEQAYLAGEEAFRG